MNIKVYLEEAVKKFEVERDREVGVAKEKVMREVVIPYNQDLDKSREKAISELTTKMNAQIQALQAQFAKDRQALIDAGEKNKTEHANTVVATETASITVAYDTEIAKLKKQIEELKA